jgi:orotidine-5'-phosphate decarboxylase
VALDGDDADRIETVARATVDHVGMFKVGLTAIYSVGPEIVSSLARYRPVFIDAKLHDIPVQVEGATRALARLGGDYVTAHAVGGVDMLKACVASAGDDLGVLAVTILTSLDDAGLERIGLRGDASSAVARLAELALDAGVDGLVCSPLEVSALRQAFGADPLLVVPGIRPQTLGDDQRRTATAAAAIAAGADIIVVGRPITQAADPGAAARELASEIGA